MIHVKLTINAASPSALHYIGFKWRGHRAAHGIRLMSAKSLGDFFTSGSLAPSRFSIHVLLLLAHII